MRTRLATMGFAFAIVLAGGPALADTFPTRPLTLIVPAGPGGTTDVLARIIAQAMSKPLGQTVIVENVGGAGGTVGTQRAARAQPDGYTLNIGNMGTLAANVSLYPKLNLDPRRDFEPIGVVAHVPMILSASKKSGFRDLRAFLDHMRGNPGKVNFATPGLGSTGHLAPTLLLQQTGAKAELVAYRGAGPALNDLLSGTMDAVIDQTVTLIPAHQGGTATALAVTSKARLPQIPEVPTFAEAGLPSFDMIVWNAIVAPKGTPGPVLDKLVSALSAALEDPEVARRYADLAAQSPASAERRPEVLGKLIAADVDRWTGIIQAAGLATQ